MQFVQILLVHTTVNAKAGILEMEAIAQVHYFLQLFRGWLHGEISARAGISARLLTY